MKLAQIFSDNMVVQANKPIRVFGQGEGTITVEFNGRTQSAQAKDGKWLVVLDAMNYGGPYEMKVSCENEAVTIKNVMVGEVILCAGQSNIEFTLGDEKYDVSNIEENPNIRHFVLDAPFKVPRPSREYWGECKKGEIGYWSAIGYHVAEILSKKNDVAIGIIGLYRGTSAIQTFMDEKFFKEHPELDIPAESVTKTAARTDKEFFWNGYGFMYHSMFEKLGNFSMGTVIWYQGESNSSPQEAPIYKYLLKGLINLWRSDLEDEKLPFVIVQICYFTVRDDEYWRQIQKAQTEIQNEVENVVTVESTDCHELHTNIHPASKIKLSQKLANYIKLTK